MPTPKKTQDEAAADVTNETGGQIPVGTEKEPDKTSMTSGELAESTHPKAPEHPLESPVEDPVETAADSSETAPAGEEPGPDATQGEKK